VLGVDERADAAAPLGLGDHVVDERRLARRLGAKDLDDAAAGQPADAEREVERERARRDRAHRDLRLVAHAHDGALAEVPLDLPEGDVQCLLAIHADQPPSATVSTDSYSAPPERSLEMKTAAADGTTSPSSGSSGRRRGRSRNRSTVTWGNQGLASGR
jgi:hypothetical protein